VITNNRCGWTTANKDKNGFSVYHVTPFTVPPGFGKRQKVELDQNPVEVTATEKGKPKLGDVKQRTVSRVHIFQEVNTCSGASPWEN